MAKKKSAQGVQSVQGVQKNPDLDVLKQLVELLDSSSATSIKLQRGDASYEVSRHAGLQGVQGVQGGHGVQFMPSTPSMPSMPSAAPSAASSSAASSSAAPSSNLLEIKSPMVGTYYRSPEPGAEPYVKAGTRVAPGQTLCIIEAMKIMNELESEVSGTVREILVEDAQPVEFGQVLFRVEP